ncbi:MAG: 50S ribosomal protein L9 [Candidatus Pelagibacter sp. TMED196]|nr:MAG: 50S ribosomal protein L9 [Candidatus Pelagibacter sp. TMED196]|tara:strand:+ start:5835 stop:6290 length:456 start_codon:yes stop_codon:yes gene_type:complete
MQIILLEDIRNLGKIGEVVNVKDGYGRNFLLKLGKALRADKSNIDFVNKKKDEINKKNIELIKSAKKVIEKIKNKKLIFKKETKENGELFAAIKPKEISKYFIENFKETIHPSQLDLKQEINKIGKFTLTINLYSDLVAELHVMVEKKDSK